MQMDDYFYEPFQNNARIRNFYENENRIRKADPNNPEERDTHHQQKPTNFNQFPL